MILKDILSISGEQGLFKFVAQGKNAMIVEHIETGKRSSAFSSAKVSSLEDISIFTDGEDLPLGKVFDRIFEKESGAQAIEAKSDPDKLKKYFEEIVPDYSKDKVYVSDIRKVFLWYNILQKKDLLVKEEPESTTETAAEGSVPEITGKGKAESANTGKKE
jgi:Domain of unknown function (DUF5606)